MAHKLAAQRLMLQSHRLMSLCPAPLCYPLERTGKAVFRRLSLDNPTSLTRLSPQVGKAKKVKTARTIMPVSRTPKVQQLGLLRMQGQAKPVESLREHLHYTFRVTLGRKHKHRIICVADEKRLAPEPGQNVSHEPDVQYLMKVYIR